MLHCWLFSCVAIARLVGDPRSVTCRLPAGALDTSNGGSGSPKAGSKQMSKGQLLNELHAMRSRMAEEQSRRREAEVEKVTRVLGCAVLATCFRCTAGNTHLTHLHSVEDTHAAAIVTAVVLWTMCKCVCCSKQQEHIASKITPWLQLWLGPGNPTLVWRVMCAVLCAVLLPDTHTGAC